MTRKPPHSHDNSSTIEQQSHALSAADISSAIRKESNRTDKMQRFTVVKRNGSIVPFRRERIFRAIEAAFRDTKEVGNDNPMPAQPLQTIERLTDLVIDELYVLASKGASLTVEGIQDQVEICLMKSGPSRRGKRLHHLSRPS